MWAVFFAFSLPPFADPTYINISPNGKQHVLKQPEGNTALLYFSTLAWFIIKALLKQVPSICYRILALELSC